VSEPGKVFRRPDVYEFDLLSRGINDGVRQHPAVLRRAFLFRALANARRETARQAAVDRGALGNRVTGVTQAAIASTRRAVPWTAARVVL
jgi:hypothetical protein